MRAAETSPNSDLLIIAHRGASAHAPENTLAAFRLAFEHGADGLEFDVRLARDGVPVCIHDATLTRTARRPGLVSSHTSRELAAIDAGSWFDETTRGRTDADAAGRAASAVSFAGETIPTLGQVFELSAGRARALYVEMKFEAGEDYGPLVARVVEEIRGRGLEETAVVESFNLDAVGRVKEIAPDVRAAALFERRAARPFPSHRRIVARAAACRADELALHHSLAAPRLVAAAREAGMRTLVWTVDEPTWVERALRLGLRAVITNRPALMRSHLDALARPT